ncbi:MAG: 3'-5' exonuclease [Nitrospirae bacterium]|nr:3'-5' exonuclease [Nitrospirota bacterium]MCL5285259.1 3'-5' exonuclease [Nitrospirota bacterium]
MNESFQDLLFLDVETTGLLMQPNARIVEISLSIWTEKGHKERHTTLINPQEPIPPLYTAIHGIDDAMVQTAPTFSVFWKERKEVFDGKTIVAHNLSFDMGMMNREIMRLERPPLGNPGIDTVPVLKTLLPEQKSHKLRNLATALRVVHKNAHRAEDDVMALEEILTMAMQKPIEILTGETGRDLALWGGLASHRYFRDSLWWAQQQGTGLKVFLSRSSRKSVGERIIEEIRLENPGSSAKRLGEFRDKGRYPLAWSEVYRVSLS